jgi:hypothetical protein
VEEQLYWARHEGVPKRDQQALELRWNDIRRQQSSLNGEVWIDKHDRRDDFTFEKTARVNSRGERVETVHASGKLSDPRTTINWRKDTIYGQRESSVRRSISGGTGDDAGHLIKAEYGADPEGVNAGRVNRQGLDPRTGEPAERLNYGLQNRTINRGESWKGVEDGTVKLVKDDKNGPYHMEVTSKTITSRDDGKREFMRTMTVKDRHQKPAEVTIRHHSFEYGRPINHDVKVKVDQYTAANPHTPQSRENQGITPPQGSGEHSQIIHSDFKARIGTRSEAKPRPPRMKI